MTEVELKFHAEPRDHAAVAAALRKLAPRPRTRRVDTTYFDTPQCEVAAHGMALRLRRDGRRWIPGLKAGRSGTGGLHARREWEFPLAQPILDLARFADTPLAALPEVATLHRRLVPAFRVDMRRTSWIVAPSPGSRLEVVLDVGRVESGERHEAISELEIECLEGDAAAAFDLADRLLGEVALLPTPVTKAQRGYRLFRHQRLVPVKARPIALEAELAPIDAARRILAAALDQLQANEEGVLRSADAEFVHQARIAIRRMRAALRMFGDVIGMERAKRWRSQLGESARAMGGARDWDVFAHASLPAAVQAFGDAALGTDLAAQAAKRRRHERAAAREALRAPRHARVVLALARWLASPEPASTPSLLPLPRLAARIIQKRHKRLLRCASDLASLSLEERHRVRIEAKRLRYGTDALASLFGARKVRQYLDALEALQDALGRANDAATAIRLVDALDASEDFKQFARGWFAAQAAADPAHLESLMTRLNTARRFWR